MLDTCRKTLAVAFLCAAAGTPAVADGAGHGLTGMRERVALYNGTLRTGPLPGGGYQVAATLPLNPHPEPAIQPGSRCPPIALSSLSAIGPPDAGFQ